MKSKLEYLKTRYGLKLAQVAILMGVSNTRLRQMERGFIQPTSREILTLDRLLKVFKSTSKKCDIESITNEQLHVIDCLRRHIANELMRTAVDSERLDNTLKITESLIAESMYYGMMMANNNNDDEALLCFTPVYRSILMLMFVSFLLLSSFVEQLSFTFFSSHKLRQPLVPVGGR